MKFVRNCLAIGLLSTSAVGQLSSGPGGAVYKPSSFPNAAEIPDITGDGVKDLLVGYPSANNGEGVVYIFEGPVSTANGYLPLPESAVGTLQAPFGFAGFGGKIELLAFDDGIDRPGILISASKEIDGVVSKTALYVHIYPEYGVTEYGYFNEQISDSEFYDTLVIPLFVVDAESVLGLPSNAGVESGSGDMPFSGPYANWNEEKEGYQYILVNNDQWGFWNWLRFKSITAGSYRAASDIAKRYEWTNGQRNAFRHAAWQGQLTAAFGRDVAKDSGDYHEEGDEGTRDSATDQYNNEVARQIMEQCLAEGESMDACINRMLEMIHNEDGTFITDPDDPRIDEILDHTLVIEDIEVVPT